ncbi:hypothetical protein Blue_009 [Bacillus phage Deep Blue]|uniref:Uncharacterized protein n=1 Tax=Bacillus phage Deep Blue TaxID=1792245 RepID=A0A140HLH0_9CAUD|nr:replication initiation protein [Bacillus phage Deep Blue]AMO25832.1 hypothetical protein Blue_009 [Bacillus phage Deep Blue]
MEIFIGEEYKLTSDTYNVIISKKYQKKTKEGEEPKFDYKEIGFYANVEQACVALLGKKLRDSEVKSITELMILIKDTKAEIMAGVNK